MKVGFVGLGNMGFPMAKNVMKAGFEVFGLNRSKGAEEKFATSGGRIASSLQELAQNMDVVITCLPLPSDVEDVYFNDAGLLKSGRNNLMLVDCSTVKPELNQRIFHEAANRGMEFLEAPVSGGTAGAAAGTLSIMVGGNQSVYEKLEPLLRAVGKDIYYLGESGNGSLVKLINQLMVALHTQAVSEALALARRNGLDLEQVVDVLRSSLAQSKVLERHFDDFIIQDNYEPGFALNLLNKDITLVSELAKQGEIQLPSVEQVKNLIKKACQTGLGDSDMSAMMEYQVQQDEKMRYSSPLKTFAVFLSMKDEKKSQEFRPQHLEFLDDRRNEGLLHANGRFMDGTGGLVIYRGSSYKEVEEWVKKDPLIINGARGYEIHEWEMVLGN